MKMHIRHHNAERTPTAQVGQTGLFSSSSSCMSVPARLDVNLLGNTAVYVYLPKWLYNHFGSRLVRLLLGDIRHRQEVLQRIDD
jgi:hypothetical protein